MSEGGILLKDNIKEIEAEILNYLYQNKLESPQSLTKIKLAVKLDDSRGETRLLKACLDSLIKTNMIKKQDNRGNYKIETIGIEHIERTQKNRA